MDPARFASGRMGNLVPIEGGEAAFVPKDLPPTITLTEPLWRLHGQAEEWLGRVRGLTQLGLIQPEVLLRPLQYREALRSSSLEGTVIDAEQLLLYELDPKEPLSADDPRNPQREVHNLRQALESGESVVQSRGYSDWTIRSLHQQLLRGVRGNEKSPGQYRTKQVFIGADHRFTPPPAHLITGLMENLVGYIQNGNDDLPPLERAMVAHYQFEAIHPFLDGNGRVGRLLLSLMLGSTTVLQRPWLYLSPFFEDHREEYFDRLFNVSTRGDWGGWLDLCLRGVIAQTEDAALRIEAMIRLYQRWRDEALKQSMKVGALRLLDRLLEGRFVTLTDAERIMGVSYVTARKYMDTLRSIGIVEIVGKYPTMVWAPEARRITIVNDARELRR